MRCSGSSSAAGALRSRPALQHIYATGLLTRRGDGTWLLRGDPPDELAGVHWEAIPARA